MSKVQRFEVPFNQASAYLQRYQAEMHRDVSTNKGFVYFSRPMQQWILLQKKGDKAIFEFSSDCPCSKMGEQY